MMVFEDVVYEEYMNFMLSAVKSRFQSIGDKRYTGGWKNFNLAYEYN